MAFFDATKKTDNSKLKQIEILQGRGFGVDDDNYIFVRADNITVTLIGSYKVDPETGKIKSGKLKGIEVTKKGGEVWSLSDLNVKITDFLDAVYADELASYIPTLFSGNDTIQGSFRDDKLYGYNHDDNIHGFGGNDKIHGGKGNDKLWGYTGNDAFIFDTKLNAKVNVDIIRDWNFIKKHGGGEDEIWLNNKIFKAFKGMDQENVSKKNFNVGNKAEKDDHFLIYNKTKGRIFYDHDGKGGDDKVLFAEVKGSPKIVHDDFLII